MISNLTNEEILQAGRCGDLQTLSYAIELLDEGILDIADEDGMNSLHYACMAGQINAVRLLLFPSAKSNAACEPNSICNGNITISQGNEAFQEYEDIETDNDESLPSTFHSAVVSPSSSQTELCLAQSNDRTWSVTKSNTLEFQGNENRQMTDVTLDIQDEGVLSYPSSSDCSSQVPATTYTTSTEFAPRTASSGVSTRSSNTGFEPLSTKFKPFMCPSCHVTRLVDSESKECLKCGEELVQFEEKRSHVNFKIRPSRTPSPWAKTVTCKGHTAMHWAALKGYTNIVKELLLCGFDVDATSLQNSTALHLAAAKGHSDCVKILLRFCPNTTITNINGSTALSTAKSMGIQKVVDLLEAYNTKLREDNHSKPATIGSSEPLEIEQ